MAVKSFTCPSCGGTLKWNISKQTFECESCRTPGELMLESDAIVHHPLEDYNDRAASEESYDEETLVICKNCGAEVLLSGTQTAGTCLMCGSTQVDSHKQSMGVPPDGLIPFKIEKTEAQERFKKWVKSRWFAPNKLKETYQQGKLDGMYLPFWTFDAEAEAWYRGRGGNYVEEEDDEGNTRTHTEWYAVSGRVWGEYDDLQICAAGDKVESVVDEILPYSTEEKSEVFADGYLSGFNAEHYNIEATAGFERAEKQIRSDLQASAKSDIRAMGYDTADVDNLDVECHNVEYKHLLLPAWLSAFAYKGKQYTYMINGETGQVGGQRPYSVPKIIAAILVGLVLLFAVYNIFIKDADACELVYPQPTTVITAIATYQLPTRLDRSTYEGIEISEAA